MPSSQKIFYLMGNWKMHGLQEHLSQVAPMAQELKTFPDIQAVLFPPFTLLGSMANVCEGTGLAWGGQNCHWKSQGPYTGEISAPMLKDLGATYVLLGHSECRLHKEETCAQICAKVQAAQEAHLNVVLCIGETREEKEAGKTLRTLSDQLHHSLPQPVTFNLSPAPLLVAYEPLWSIGTGKVPRLEEMNIIYAHLREELKKKFNGQGAQIPLLYGGSVTAENVDLFVQIPYVSGVLVGGASLTAQTFLPIARRIGLTR